MDYRIVWTSRIVVNYSLVLTLKGKLVIELPRSLTSVTLMYRMVRVTMEEKAIHEHLGHGVRRNSNSKPEGGGELSCGDRGVVVTCLDEADLCISRVCITGGLYCRSLLYTISFRLVTQI